MARSRGRSEESRREQDKETEEDKMPKHEELSCQKLQTPFVPRKFDIKSPLCNLGEFKEMYGEFKGYLREIEGNLRGNFRGIYGEFPGTKRVWAFDNEKSTYF